MKNVFGVPTTLHIEASSPTGTVELCLCGPWFDLRGDGFECNIQIPYDTSMDDGVEYVTDLLGRISPVPAFNDSQNQEIVNGLDKLFEEMRNVVGGEITNGGDNIQYCITTPDLEFKIGFGPSEE